MSEKIDALVLEEVKKWWDDEEGCLKAFQDFQKNAITVILDHFGYDCSVLSDDQWDFLAQLIFDEEYGQGKERVEAIKAGFRTYVMDEGGPEVLGIEEEWE